MNKKLITSAFVIVSVGAAIPAMAQESKPVGLSVRAGIFFPTQGSAKDAGKNWFIGGAEYKLNNMHFGKMGANAMNQSVALSVDFYNKSNISNVPVLLNYISRTDEYYFTLGAGIGFNRLPNGSGGTESKARFAGAVGLGYDFQRGKSPLFTEARYLFNSKSDLNGFAVMVGIRL
jgi:hypothetical protein